MTDDDKDKESPESASSSDAGAPTPSVAGPSVQESEEAWKRMGLLIDERVKVGIEEGLKSWQPATTSQKSQSDQGAPQTRSQSSGGQQTRSKSKPVKLGFLERMGLFGDPAKLIKSRQE